MVARKDNKEGVTRKRKQGDQFQVPVKDIKADTNANPLLKQKTISPQVIQSLTSILRLGLNIASTGQPSGQEA